MNNFTNAEMQKIKDLGIELQLVCELPDISIYLSVEFKGRNKKKLYVADITDKRSGIKWKEAFETFEEYTEFIYSRIYSQETFDMNGKDTDFNEQGEEWPY